MRISGSRSTLAPLTNRALKRRTLVIEKNEREENATGKVRKKFIVENIAINTYLISGNLY